MKIAGRRSKYFHEHIIKPTQVSTCVTTSNLPIFPIPHTLFFPSTLYCYFDLSQGILFKLFQVLIFFIHALWFVKCLALPCVSPNHSQFKFPPFVTDGSEQVLTFFQYHLLRFKCSSQHIFCCCFSLSIYVFTVVLHFFFTPLSILYNVPI